MPNSIEDETKKLVKETIRKNFNPSLCSVSISHRTAPSSSTPMSSSNSSVRGLRIGIVGFGPFAQFLAKTMIKQGHFLRATSRSDHSRKCAQLGIPFFREIDEFMEMNHDVILLCTSIVSLSEVVKAIPFQSLKSRTLFADVLSVKEYPREVLLQAVPSDSDLLCTHPMFGPESGRNGWRGLAFMFDKVRVRNEDICSSFLNIFASEVKRPKTILILRLRPRISNFLRSRDIDKTALIAYSQGCKMMEMTCEDHDKLAARTQFLTHAVGRVLNEMEIQSTSIDTRGFQKLIDVKESSANDSFDLFRGLFIHNKFAIQELENFESAFNKVKEKLLDKAKQDDGS